MRKVMLIVSTADGWIGSVVDPSQVVTVDGAFSDIAVQLNETYQAELDRMVADEAAASPKLKAANDALEQAHRLLTVAGIPYPEESSEVDASNPLIVQRVRTLIEKLTEVEVKWATAVEGKKHTGPERREPHPPTNVNTIAL
jgi:hypothetical protein